MSDEKSRLGFHRDRLRRHATGPEDGNLTRLDLHWIAEIRPMNIANADTRRIANVHRGAMSAGKAAADLHGAARLFWRHRPHRHHHRPMESPCRMARKARSIHGHIATHLEMTKRQTRLQQGVFE